MTKRVVVTGTGALCGLGMNRRAIIDNMMEGLSFVHPIKDATHFDAMKYSQTQEQKKPRVVIAINQTDEHLGLAAGLEEKVARRRDRHQLFAEIAVGAALSVAQFDPNNDPTRRGVAFAVGGGGLTGAFDADETLIAGKKLSPFANLKQLPNIMAGYIANRWGFQGPNSVECTACAASAKAIIHGAQQIVLGQADMMIVGGTEAAITPYGIASFAAQRALGSDSCPYQRDRNGFVMGEGAAALVLESEEHALARGVPILAVLSGYGDTADGVGDEITAPHPDGGARSARLALKMAHLSPDEIDYVNTHGTATPLGDIAELEGIRAWGDVDVERLTISSTKSHTGHLLGAAAALEAVFAIEAIASGYIPTTRGLTEENLDPQCAGFDHVIRKPRQKRVQHALSNSFGFGGTNATLIFSQHAQ